MKTLLSETGQSQKDQYSLYEKSKVITLTETVIRTVVAIGWEEGARGRGQAAQWYRFSHAR